MLTEEKIAEIRDSVDLVALISEYVPLRRQGARFVGLCPFHSEKSPSFGVSRGKNFYYCFGCHASGDAISFLRHVEGLAFPQALEKLAERSGIELPKQSDDPQQAAQARARAARERLAEVMGLAQEFFVAELEQNPHAEIARAEIERRNITLDVARKFNLGYAPSGWAGLAEFLASRRVELRDAVEVGLIAPRRQGSGHYDRFRHRLMFPVADQHGRIIAFSGRALAPPAGEEPPDPPPAKYINSPESALYKKGQALFGIHAARVALRKHNQALLCEGNFDLLAIHQAGFEHVVAPLGTAFTLDQAKLLRRFVEEVVVVFDGDAAGRKATRTAYELLDAAGLRGRVVRLPQGHDPDSFLRSDGTEAFRTRVQNALPMLEFLIGDAAEVATDPATRARAIQELGPLLARIESPIERDQYVTLVAQKFEVRDVRLVRAELNRGVQQARAGRKPLAERGGNAAVLAGTVSRPPTTPVRDPAQLPQRQCEVVGALLDCPALFASAEAQQLDGLLTDPDLQAIFRFTAQMIETRGEVDAPALLDGSSSNPARAWLVKRLSESPKLSAEAAKGVIQNAIPHLKKAFKEARIAELKRQIESAKRNGDLVRANELMRERDEVFKS
jgi:DNA primase